MNENMENNNEAPETLSQEVLVENNESSEILNLQADIEKSLGINELSIEEQEKVQGIIEDSATISLLAEKGSKEAKIADIGNAFASTEIIGVEPSLANKALVWVNTNLKKIIAVGTLAIAAAGPMQQANAGVLTDVVVNEGIHQVDIKARGVQRDIENEDNLSRQHRDFEMRTEESRQRMEDTFILRENRLNEEFHKQIENYNLKRKIWEEGRRIDPTVSAEAKAKELSLLEDERKKMLGQQDIKWNTFASQTNDERTRFEHRVKEEEKRFAHHVERGRDDVDRQEKRERDAGLINAGGQIVKEATRVIFKK